MSINITFKGNDIFFLFFFFLRKTQAHSHALLLYITVRVDLWICFLPMKDHASSFVSKKSVALGIEAIDKNKAILERMVEYKNYSQTSV